MTDPGSTQEPADDRDEDEDFDPGDDAAEEVDEEPEEPEMPSLGDTVDGRVFVCHGDDRPEYYVRWLESAVDRFQRLEDLSAEHDLPMQDTGIDFDRGVMDFLADAGIDFDSSHWEGSCTSGIYQMGWVDAKKVDAVEQAIDDLLDAAEKEMRDRLLDRLRTGFEEAVSYADLDELLEFKATNALELKAEVARLREENLRLKLEVSDLRKQAARRSTTRSRPKKPPDPAS